MAEMVQTTWSPDTCDCTVVYEWERGSPEDGRVHTPHSTVQHCPAHAHLTDHHAHVHELWAENRHKNTHRQKLADGLGVDVGTITHSYDENRVLHLHHKDLTDPLAVPR